MSSSEWLMNCVWRKQRTGDSVEEREWCLWMREKRKMNCWYECYPCIWKRTAWKERRWWERVCLFVRMSERKYPPIWRNEETRMIFHIHWWVKWVWASLFISSFHHNHFAWPIHLIYQHKRNAMHLHQVEWKSVQAGLFISLFLVDSLSNTAREQFQNANPPKRSNFRLGKSIHHFILWESLFNVNGTWQKLKLSCSNTPISIISREGTSSISHTE